MSYLLEVNDLTRRTRPAGTPVAIQDGPDVRRREVLPLQADARQLLLNGPDELVDWLTRSVPLKKAANANHLLRESPACKRGNTQWCCAVLRRQLTYRHRGWPVFCH